MFPEEAMKATYQIGGRSPFPIITNFLAYAIARSTVEASARAPTKTKEAANK
jgi:hypothetical protein